MCFAGADLGDREVGNLGEETWQDMGGTVLSAGNLAGNFAAPEMTT